MVPSEPCGWKGAGGKRGEKNSGRPNVIAIDALASLYIVRYYETTAPVGRAARFEETIFQNSRMRSTRCSGALPAISAELMVPIKIPAT